MVNKLMIAAGVSLWLVLPAMALQLSPDEEQTGKITDTKLNYELTIPRLQKIKVTLSDLPKNSDIMLGMADWPHGGWRGNKGKDTVSYEVDPKNTSGKVWIQITSYGGISKGNWQAIKIVPGGPWYSLTEGAHPEEIKGVEVLPVKEFKIKVELVGPKPDPTAESARPQTPGEKPVQGSDPLPVSEDSHESSPVPEFYTFKAPWTNVQFDYPSNWQGGKAHTPNAAFIHSPDQIPHNARIFVGELKTGASCRDQIIMDQDRWTGQGADLFVMNTLNTGTVKVPYAGVVYKLANPKNKNETKNMATITFMVPEQSGCRKVLFQVVKEDWETYFPVLLTLTETLTSAGGEQ